MPRWEPDASDRLWDAALSLFEERGYDATTVADIAGRAGLTKRSFFRHFADKREVLFAGSENLERLIVSAIEATPGAVEPLPAAVAGLQAGASWFDDVRDVARRRQRIIDANPELQERELLKLVSLAAAIGATLAARGVDGATATLAAEASVTVFRVAFGRWALADDSGSLGAVLSSAFDQLQALTSPLDATLAVRPAVALHDSLPVAGVRAQVQDDDTR